MSSNGDSSDLDAGSAEVEQQAERQARYSEIVKALRQMHVVNTSRMLQFYEYERLNEQVGYILADDNSIVSGDHGVLLNYGESCFA